jgi:hypothetical protein
MALPRRSKYGFNKKRSYRSFKKRKSNDAFLIKLVGLVIVLAVISWILELIVHFVVAYYYSLIMLALVVLSIYVFYNKSKFSKFRAPSEFSDTYKENSLKELKDLKDYELDSNKTPEGYLEQNLKAECIEKGDNFEKYVAERFDDKLFSIVEWTTDMSRKHNRFVEADCNPDLVIRDRKTNNIFCIECKYRSRLVNEYFEWSYPDQMDRYFSYAHERKIPFYAVLGLGGSPDFPSEVFCIPLEGAKNPQIHINTLQKYRHNPGENFIWDGKHLK